MGPAKRVAAPRVLQWVFGSLLSAHSAAETDNELALNWIARGLGRRKVVGSNPGAPIFDVARAGI